MATPRPVSKKLRELLGAEAADTMVEWLNGIEGRHDALRHETRADVAELRQEMRAGFAELRGEMQAGFAAVEVKFAQVYVKFAEMDAKLDAKFAGMDTRLAAMDARLAQRNADLMKWLVGFWLASLLGTIGAIVALGRVRP